MALVERASGTQLARASHGFNGIDEIRHLNLAISLAAERILEVLKGWLPDLPLFTPSPDPAKESKRCAWMHVVAGFFGTLVAVIGKIDTLQSFNTGWGTDVPGWLSMGTSFVFAGILASGGSAFWNHTLDLLKAAKVPAGTDRHRVRRHQRGQGLVLIPAFSVRQSTAKRLPNLTRLPCQDSLSYRLQGEVMPRETADIVGSTHADFDITFSSGTVAIAKLNGVEIPVANGNTITISDLPEGDSSVHLGMIFAPGDPDALIGVGAVRDGAAVAAVPPGTVDSTSDIGEVLLFGEAQ